MKLARYMELNGVKDHHLAEIIGRSRETVTKYRLGKVQPPLEVIAAIEAATKGRVSFDDFLKS